jgi:hypothetical protein
VNRRTRAAAAILLAVPLGACSESTAPSAAKAANFAAGVCPSISTWENDLVDTANMFTDLSPHLSVEGRRAQYLFAFDKQERITEELRAQVEAAPSTGVEDAAALRESLGRAIDDVLQNIHDNRADAAANVEFNTFGPRPDRLFAGTEKSLSLLLKPLDQLARDQHLDALGGSCGR